MALVLPQSVATFFAQYYSGAWARNLMHGYGEYTWNSFYNATMTYPAESTYEGKWQGGAREGAGKMYFGGIGGAKMFGYWVRNLKHGPGRIFCGNGKTMQLNPLFRNDKPVHLCSISHFDVALTDFYDDSARKMSKNGPSQSRTTFLSSAERNGSKTRSSKRLESIGSQLLEKNRTKNSKSKEFGTKVPPRFNPMEIPLQKMSECVDISYFIDRVHSGTGTSHDSEFDFFLNKPR